MTRPEKISKRKAFNKEVRAHATHEQTSFATVLTRTLDLQKTRSYRAMKNLPSHLPRNTKRVDTSRSQPVEGVSVRDDDVVRRHDVNCGYCDFDVEDEEEENENENEGRIENSKSFVVDLVGMAKPAKPKGVAKEYEIVGKVRSVIALEDEDEDDGDEWEEVDFEYSNKDGGTFVKRSYSAALKER